MCVLSHLSCVRLFVMLWTVAHQASLSMGFSRQEYWIGLPCLPPGYLPDPGIEPVTVMSPTLAGGFLTTSAAWEVLGECLTARVSWTSSLRPHCLPTLVDHAFRYSEVVVFITDDA